MLFTPQKSKYKKYQKGKAYNRINSKIVFNQLHFGSVGLKALYFTHLTSKQILTLYKALKKILKKKGKIKFNIFPHSPISKKPNEIRMGKGKGNINHWVFKVKPGFVLCEIETSTIQLALLAIKYAQIKLPIKTKIILN